jgi:hypothetical protein
MLRYYIFTKLWRYLEKPYDIFNRSGQFNTYSSIPPPANHRCDVLLLFVTSTNSLTVDVHNDRIAMSVYMYT